MARIIHAVGDRLETEFAAPTVEEEEEETEGTVFGAPTVEVLDPAMDRLGVKSLSCARSVTT